ncbi:hypothetical protein [uncultured Dubosiella sp.]|uniref:hypothetical protein n=2 Tax=uncultured Dubosiella sp. TaxID=1937011 RepID=UPI002594CC68|nr:hypothetical protein [uncultured Dubosiella sp.]
MKNGKVLSFTMGCEADPTSRVKVVSDGEIIRVEGLSDEGEPFTIDFELPLEGLRQFQENVKPFLTSSDDVDLENPTNYDWTLKYKADGMEMSTNGIISSANVFKDMKVNILKTLYEVQQKYDYAMKNGAKLKELVDRIEEKAA